MKEVLLDTVYRLYNKGDFQYILAKYIDMDFWIRKFYDNVDQFFVDNLTEH